MNKICICDQEMHRATQKKFSWSGLNRSRLMISRFLCFFLKTLFQKCSTLAALLRKKIRGLLAFFMEIFFLAISELENEFFSPILLLNRFYFRRVGGNFLDILIGQVVKSCFEMFPYKIKISILVS